jgi:Tol biopolymer transport system component
MKVRVPGRSVLPLILGTLALLFASPLSAQVAPDGDWRTLDTPHFRVNFVTGLDSIAARAGERAERAYDLLAGQLPHAPRGRIELTLADNVDFANGYATPLPTNRIVVYTHPPLDSPELDFYADWVELIVLHELTHIFQLDTSEGIWRQLRTVLGRNPALFPELYSPSWVKEGLAVYFESRLTPTGRLRGTQHEMALRTAMLEDEFFPIDRASSDPVLWPGGNASYIYGAHFLDYLSRRYGADRIPAYIERSARQIEPYLLDRPAKQAFGTSFTAGWREWEASLRTRYRAQADSLRALGLTEPEVLTGAGREASFPRFAPAGGAIAFAGYTGREEPSLRLIEPDGEIRTVAPLTSLAPPSWSPDGRDLIFPQLDYADPYRIHSGLYRAPAAGGDADRIGKVDRIWESDLAPDGRRVVGVTSASGTNVLTLVDLSSGSARRITTPDLDVHWSLPRFSPRGDRIAVERWSAGGFLDVVLVDTTGAVLRSLTRDRAIDAAPAWSPDGRYVLFSSDRTGIPNIFAYDLRTDRLLQVTNLLTGATQPDVSPDSHWIAFALYRADGYHIARIPYAPATWRPAPAPTDSLLAPADSLALERHVASASRPYSPFPTVLPSSWLPVASWGDELGLSAGVAVSGEDAISRHLWAADASLYLDGTRFDGGAGYVYRGLGRPTLAATAVQRWDVVQSGFGESAVLRRERKAQLSALWLRQRMRSAAWLTTAADLSDRFYTWDELPPAGAIDPLPDLPLDVGAGVTAGYSTVRSYAYSFSAEEGFRITSRLEGHTFTRAGANGARPDYLRSVTQGRGYLPLDLGGFARHVLAARVDLGIDRGSGSPLFDVGGASGGTAPIPVEIEALGGGLTFPVRGYPEGAQFGTTALTASAEYRFPLALVQRGIRVLPVFLDRISGDVFADAGTACLTGECFSFTSAEPRDGLLTSVGAELTVVFQVGFGASLPLRFGIAQPLNSDFGGKPRFYIRVGIS